MLTLYGLIGIMLLCAMGLLMIPFAAQKKPNLQKFFWLIVIYRYFFFKLLSNSWRQIGVDEMVVGWQTTLFIG